MRGELYEWLKPETIKLLADLYGAGCYLWVPDSTAHPKIETLVLSIGAEQASRLVEGFGGLRIYLPGLAKPNGQRRGPTIEEVRNLSEKGWSAPRIARKFKVSERCVLYRRAAIKRAKAEAEANGLLDGKKGNGRKSPTVSKIRHKKARSRE